MFDIWYIIYIRTKGSHSKIVLIVLHPFAHMLINAVKKTQLNTLRRLIYGLIQFYPVYLARMTYKWKGNNALILMNSNNDNNGFDGYNSDENNNKIWDEYINSYNIFDKIIKQILVLMVCKNEEIRTYSIKFAAQMILLTTNHQNTNDINKFSLKNIKVKHPILNDDKLINTAKMWLKELAEALNQPSTIANQLTKFTSENTQICIRKLFKIAEDRLRVKIYYLYSILCICV